jgi:hypothetical protein
MAVPGGGAQPCLECSTRGEAASSARASVVQCDYPIRS